MRSVPVARASLTSERSCPAPFLDADDIAYVAVAALTDSRHVGELYELTGPGRSPSQRWPRRSPRQQSATYGMYRSRSQHTAEAAAHRVPAEIIELLTYLFGEVVDGRNANTTDDVRRALRREPRDFADYAQEAAATGQSLAVPV